MPWPGPDHEPDRVLKVLGSPQPGAAFSVLDNLYPGVNTLAEISREKISFEQKINEILFYSEINSISIFILKLFSVENANFSIHINFYTLYTIHTCLSKEIDEARVPEVNEPLPQVSGAVHWTGHKYRRTQE